MSQRHMEKKTSFMLDTINVIKEVAKSNVESLEESSFSSSSEDEVIVK